MMVGRDRVKRDQMMLGTLLNQFARGQINKNHPLQRKPNQWSDEAASGLAATIIKGEDIDSIKICEQIVSSTEFILWLIDGLQRLTVLESYKNNVFEIKKNIEMPIMYYQGVDENGKIGIIKYDLREKRYRDLPDELKEKFDSYAVDIVKHLDCTDEEIAYHIARYNRQTSMNVNQKNILSAWKIAPEIKKLVSNRFFADCGNYNPKEDTKEVFNRIVCESIMTMFHLDNWKKAAKQISLYLNDNATNDEFEIFESELNRLYKIINQDTVGQLFNAKNSFICYAEQRIIIAITLELLTSVYEISAGAMRGLGHSLLPAIITVIGSCVLRLIWISTVCRVFHEFWVLIIIYPISWIITGIIMVIAYHVIKGKVIKAA